VILSPAFAQSLPVAWEIVGSDPLISGTFDLRNRNLSVLTALGGLGVGIAGAVATTFSKCTLRVYVARSQSNGLWIRIYNSNSTSYQERQAITSAPETSAGVAVIGNEELSIVYDLGCSVWRITSADEGKTWSEAVSITTGTYPQVAYSKRDLAEVVSYIDGTTAYVKRKMGTAAWSSAIEVCTVAEGDVVTLTPIDSGSGGEWVLFVRQADEAIRRYKSLNSGGTWALDE
jgi:hypothetical protein